MVVVAPGSLLAASFDGPFEQLERALGLLRQKSVTVEEKNGVNDALDTCSKLRRDFASAVRDKENRISQLEAQLQQLQVKATTVVPEQSRIPGLERELAQVRDELASKASEFAKLRDDMLTQQAERARLVSENERLVRDRLLLQQQLSVALAAPRAS